MGKWPRAPYFGDLSASDRQTLMEISGPDDIKSCQITNDWEDDHLVCLSAKINGIELSFWWVGWDGAGAFKYAEDSGEAREGVFNALKHEIENWKEDSA